MNDFLQSLRNGTLKRQDRNRKNYDKPQYRNAERGGNRDKRNGNMNKSFGSPELGEIKKLLQSMNDNAELARIAQERSAEALERIALSLQAMTQPEVRVPEAAATAAPPADETTTPDLQTTAETALETENLRARTVSIIQDMRNDGNSFETIAQNLNDQGVPTFSGKGKWRTQNVSRAFNAAVSEAP